MGKLDGGITPGTAEQAGYDVSPMTNSGVGAICQNVQGSARQTANTCLEIHKTWCREFLFFIRINLKLIICLFLLIMI